MTKAEIEFLISAGFTLAEIMGMKNVQNAENNDGSAPGSAAPAGQIAQNEPAAPAAPAPAPAAPAPVKNEDHSPIIEKLDTLIAAIQAGNRAAASITPPARLSPEEIAGKLL